MDGKHRDALEGTMYSERDGQELTEQEQAELEAVEQFENEGSN